MTTPTPVICQVYSSTKKPGMYLIVDKSDGLEKVPEALLERFGNPKPAMTFVLREDRTLAKVSTADLARALQSQGYFLQFPDVEEGEMKAVADRNDKLY